MNEIINVKVKLKNLMRIDNQIKTLKRIKETYPMSLAETMTMFDTISIIEGIKQEASQ